VSDLFTDLQPFIITQARALFGGEPLPSTHAADVVALFQAQPNILAYARAELVRLSDHDGNRRLREYDHESRMRATAIEHMLQQFEANLA
jgi:hypothetical protein